MSVRSFFDVARTALLLAALAVPAAARAQTAQTPAGASGYQPLRADAPAPLDAMVTLDVVRTPLATAIEEVARQAGLSIAFDRTLPGLDRPVTLRASRLSAAVAILRLLDGAPLTAMASASGSVVLVARPAGTPRTTTVQGHVRDASTGGALAGARIELVGTRFTTTARTDGRFAFGTVPHGAYRVRVVQMGYRPALLGPVMVDGQPADSLRVALERAPTPLGTVVVTPGHYGVMDGAADAAPSMSRAQIEAAPQLGEDIYRAVGQLPGVSTDEFAAAFSVRGFGGDELYVSFDGLELIEPFHLKDIGGGALSILDASAIGAVELTTGGFAAEYGDRLGGVFTMRSIDPRRDRTRTALGLSIMNARASSQGGFANGRGGWLVSARRGYLDIAMRLTSMHDSLRPRYYDAFAKADYTLRGGGRLAAHVLRAGDDLVFRDREEGTLLSGYGSSYAWLTWDGRADARLRQRTVASVGRLTWRRDADALQLDAFGRRVPSAAIDDHRVLDVLGVRQDWKLDVSPRALLKWGVDARRESASYDYARWLLRESVAAPGEIATRRDTVAARRALSGTRLGVYVAQRVRPVDALAVEVGLRHDRASVARDAITSPRLNVSWQPRAGTALRAAWGRYSQSQPLAGMQVQDGETALSPAERSAQRVLGVTQLLPRGITARAELYDQRIAPRRPRFANVGGSVGELVPELLWDRVLVAADAGRARGVELQLAGDGRGRLDWSAGYTLASATDRVEGRDVPRITDQRHSARLDWSYHPTSNRWRLSVASMWHTGRPFTPQLADVDTVLADPKVFWLILTRRAGALASERLPDYRRVDARWTRYFDTRRGRVSVFAEVFNLLGTRNVGAYYTNADVDGQRRQVRLYRVSDEMIPRLPTAGIAWEF